VNIRPVADNVVVELLPAEQVTRDGIVIPDTARKPEISVIRARVVASGPGHYRSKSTGCGGRASVGQLVPNETKPGDLVIIDRMAGQNYDWDLSAPRRNGDVSWNDHSGEFRIVREEQIHAIIDGDVSAVS